jgi:hypothetical protein
MEWMMGLVIMLGITYFALMVSHYFVVWLIKVMKWDKTDWFHDMVEEESNYNG